MRRQFFKIGLLTALFITVSTLAFSYYHKTVVVPTLNSTEASCQKEAQKSSEMIFEKLAKQFVGAVILEN